MSRRARPCAACGNFFNLIRDFQQLKAMTPCVAINYRGIFIMTSILLLMAKCEDQLCSNCTEEQITRRVPGKCDVCWPCDLIECHVGYGSSVACGTTVSRNTDIGCVACTSGVNFSDTSGSLQCQPCATCAGKHEHVLENCSPESNVKCECEDGYYRNRTTKECLPCVLCCTDDWKIAKRCRGDEGEIAKKCKFKLPWTKACFSLSVSSTISDASKPIEHHSSVVVVTSSSLLINSFLHTTATPLLQRITVIASAVSKTLRIEATSSSTLGHARQSGILSVSESLNADSPLIKEKKKEETPTAHISDQRVIVIILASFLLTIVLVIVFVLIVGCVVILKKYKSKKSVSVSQNDMEKGKENDDGESSASGSVIAPLLPSNEDPNEIPLVPLESDKTCEAQDFSKYVSSSTNQEGQGVDVQIEKGIPTSLDNEPRHKGQRPRKRIPSEGEDKTEPSLDGICDVNQTADCPLVKPLIQSTGYNKGYLTHINDVPSSLINSICMLLDEERDFIDGKDYTMLASKLNVNSLTIRHLKQQKQSGKISPSYILLLQVFASMKDSGTLKHLCSILEGMERYDVTRVIDQWAANNP